MTHSRRSVLMGSLALSGMALGTGPVSGQQTQGPSPAPAGDRTVFVLIHGGSHGGWCWARVADRLLALGHKVYAPSLTGLADRSHLMSGLITLDTHVKDIANLFRWEQLDNVVLVAHSYGGWPVTGALEQVADKVSAVVYLDAFVPEDGQSGQDLLSPTVRQMMDDAVARGEVSRPVPAASFFKLQTPEDEAWVDAMMTPQPIGVALQPIRLSGALETVPSKTYVRAPAFAQGNFDRAYQRAREDAGWRALEMDCGHDVMIDDPERVTEILLEARA